MADYELSFTAQEIDEKLKKVEEGGTGYTEGETVHPIDPKYLPESVGYVSYEKKLLAPETVVSKDGISGVNFAEPIVHGKVYAVIYDGVEYVCETTVRYNNTDFEWIYLGNVDNVEGAEPFTITVWPKDYVYGDFFFTDDNEHTVAVYERTEIVHPIDPKVLPKEVVTKVIDLNKYPVEHNPYAIVEEDNVLGEFVLSSVLYNGYDGSLELSDDSLWNDLASDSPRLIKFQGSGIGILTQAVTLVRSGDITAQLIFNALVMLNGTTANDFVVIERSTSTTKMKVLVQPV